MVGGAAREPALVHRELPQQMPGLHPHAVERKYRKARGEGRKRRRFFEMPVQPPQRPAPEIPFVQITHQHGGHRPLVFEQREYPLHLFAALGGAQAEMRRHHAQRPAAAVELDVDGAARLAPGDAEIDPAHRRYGVARQETVAVVAALVEERGPGDRLVTRFAGEVGEHVEPRSSRFDLLQREHAGLELREHAHDALRHEMAVGADAAVYVVRREPDRRTAHVSACAGVLLRCAAEKWRRRTIAAAATAATTAASKAIVPKPGLLMAAAARSTNSAVATMPGVNPSTVPTMKSRKPM